MYTVRKVSDNIMFALVAESNQRRLDDVAAVTTHYHLDQTNKSEGGDARSPTVTRLTVTAPTATNLATSIALLANCKAVMNAHFADTIAHDTAVSAASTGVAATTTATAITEVNIFKGELNAHFTAASVHFNNDAANTITSATATDQTTVDTMLNEIKAAINAHMKSAPTGAFITLVDP